jgi:hypothetical protein
VRKNYNHEGHNPHLFPPPRCGGGRRRGTVAGK